MREREREIVYAIFCLLSLSFLTNVNENLLTVLTRTLNSDTLLILLKTNGAIRTPI